MSKKKGLDFKHKEVINIKNGTRLGYFQYAIFRGDD